MSRANRGRGDDGAVLVEAILVAPVLLAILFGIIEFGLGWRDKITVETATVAGARTSASLGNDSMADYNALQTAVSAMSTIPTSNIDYIVIFKANSSGTIPATCAAGTAVSNSCNVYVPSTFTLASSSFGCGAASPDRFWCPTSRVESQSTGPDYIGVYVKAHRSFSTQLFGTTGPTITSTSVMRIEPLSP